jgi:hypothetical protein
LVFDTTLYIFYGESLIQYYYTGWCVNDLLTLAPAAGTTGPPRARSAASIASAPCPSASDTLPRQMYSLTTLSDHAYMYLLKKYIFYPAIGDLSESPPSRERRTTGDMTAAASQPPIMSRYAGFALSVHGWLADGCLAVGPRRWRTARHGTQPGRWSAYARSAG